MEDGADEVPKIFSMQAVATGSFTIFGAGGSLALRWRRLAALWVTVLVVCHSV